MDSTTTINLPGLQRKLQSLPGKSRRLHFDAFELAACILSVHVTHKLVRHRHIRGWLPDHKAASRHLLRKRAKRAFIRIHGQAAFAERSRRFGRSAGNRTP